MHSHEIEAFRQTARRSPPPWMETREEQRLSIQACKEAFRKAPVEPGDWQHFLQPPQWAGGTALAAIDGGFLAGNATIYADPLGAGPAAPLGAGPAAPLGAGPAAPLGGEAGGGRSGATASVLVRPAGRGGGIARSRLRAAGLGTAQADESRLYVLGLEP